MLTCIACSKQLNGNGSLQQNDEDNAAGTPSTKQAVKALTAQVLLVVQYLFGFWENVGKLVWILLFLNRVFSTVWLVIYVGFVSIW